MKLSDVEAARERIAPHVLITPAFPSPDLNAAMGMDVWLKCENLQAAGAFKSRGACNAVFALSDAAASRGVATHSSGNHAAALARAAKLRGIDVHIVMPRNSRSVKLRAVSAYGVEPVLCGPTAEDRQRMADEVVAATGATFVHPYNDPLVMAGQGTVAMEILQQVDDIDALVVPVGGGGLLAGCLTVLKERKPSIRVYAAEPHWADDAYRSLRSKRIETPTRYDSIADGLRTPLGTRTFPIIQRYVDDVLLVSEDAIRQATSAMPRYTRMIVEPSGAVPIAALLEHRQRFGSGRVVTVLSGGNLELADLVQANETSP